MYFIILPVPLFWLLFLVSVSVSADIVFTKNEIALIKTLSSQQYNNAPDNSNHVSGNTAAIVFGKTLFFSKKLSGDQTLSCASCHQPTMGWSNHDAITHKRPDQLALRHTPSLWGVKYNRWYFWDGRADSLWSQALQPIESRAEMAGSRVQLAQLIMHTPALRHTYEALFGSIPLSLLQADLPKTGKPLLNDIKHPEHRRWQTLMPEVQHDINLLYVNIGKSLAAFEETLVSHNTPFDQFVATLTTKPITDSAILSSSALRGLKLFIGKAACTNCHFGANFSDGEFHHIFLKPVSLTGDLGRYDGIKKLLNNPFNSHSTFSDLDQKQLNKLDYVYQNSVFRAQFKTPSLRNVALTYPYMHTGQLKTLQDVVHYYNTISERITPNSHQELLLKSLNLSSDEEHDLVAFLHSLTEIKAVIE